MLNSSKLDDYRQRRNHRRSRRRQSSVVCFITFVFLTLPQIIAGYGYILEKISNFLIQPLPEIENIKK
jgi:hypothetical protein